MSLRARQRGSISDRQSAPRASGSRSVNSTASADLQRHLVLAPLETHLKAIILGVGKPADPVARRGAPECCSRAAPPILVWQPRLRRSEGPEGRRQIKGFEERATWRAYL